MRSRLEIPLVIVFTVSIIMMVNMAMALTNGEIPRDTPGVVVSHFADHGCVVRFPDGTYQKSHSYRCPLGAKVIYMANGMVIVDDGQTPSIQRR